MLGDDFSGIWYETLVALPFDKPHSAFVIRRKAAERPFYRGG
jgi:hypothetical protein